MKISKTLKTFSQDNQVKTLTKKQKRSVNGGLEHVFIVYWENPKDQTGSNHN